MTEKGVVEPAQCAWASPVELVPKPSESWMFYIDYRRLNAITICDAYPLPRMDDYIDCLGEANMFTTPDAYYGGYSQVPLHEAEKNKTTFTRQFCT